MTYKYKVNICGTIFCDNIVSNLPSVFVSKPLHRNVYDWKDLLNLIKIKENVHLDKYNSKRFISILKSIELSMKEYII